MRPTSFLLALILVVSAAVTASSQTLEEPVADDCHSWDSAAGIAETCEVQGSTLPLGATAFEPTMGVGPDGALYMATTPSRGVAVGFGVGVHKSTDLGESWVDVQPRIAGQTVPPETNDPYGYVDPGTGRVFSFHMSPILLCSIMSFSDDGGETWTTPPVGCGPSGAWDHQTMVAAPPTDGVITLGYPNVLVQCVNSVYAEMCARSLDGGLTWGTGYPAYVNENLASLCGTQTGHLAADADGVLYLPTPICGERASVYVSEDSGLTWQERVIHDAPMPFTDPAIDIDGAGNVHAVWLDDDHRLNYATSTDKGVTWTEPVFVTAPGVLAALPALVAGDEGNIAIAFPATTDLPDGYDDDIPDADVAWGAYMAVAQDATDGSPTFSVVRSSGDDPILRGQSCASRCALLVDFIDVVVTPDGRAFGAFVDGCTDEDCIAGMRSNDITGSGNGRALVATVDLDLCADTCHHFADAETLASSPLATPSIELDAATAGGSAMPHPAEVLGETRFRHLHEAYTQGVRDLFG